MITVFPAANLCEFKSIQLAVIFNPEYKMHILVAPNAFKNSLSAEDAAEAIRQGLLDSGFPCSIQCFPIGDGGDGTASLIVKQINGHFENVQATDPMGKKIDCRIGFSADLQTAVIEMADISGLKLLQQNEPDPLHATSFGTGELIRKALDKGTRKIILGIGGSATIDGGCGALQALGIRFLDKSKNVINGLPENLVHLDSIDVSGMDKRIEQTELIVLCDVNNFLLGDTGAAAVFGPQKGASPEDVVKLEKSLTRLREVSFRQTGKDMNAIRHGGAAGGIAAGLQIFLGANLAQGIEYFLDTTGFDKELEKASLLITGEGGIDLQTLEGKGPYGVATRAKKKNIPVIGLAGRVPSEPDETLDYYFDMLMEIGRAGEDSRTAMLHTAENLRHTAAQLGKMLSIWT
jgi:glycerate kinase